MTTIFDDMPEFIDSDVRVKRPVHVSYRIDAEFMQKRHEAMLPQEMVKGKRVLDLGCAVATTGAWCLHHGAAQYVGVEFQSKMVNSARENLQKYFSTPEDTPKWSIFNCLIETFLGEITKEGAPEFDIIVVSGVIYGVIDYFGFIKTLSSIAKEIIVIESMHPWKIMDRNGSLTPMNFWAQMTNFPIVQYTQKIRHSHEDGTKSYEYDGVRISVGAFEQAFAHLGWEVDIEPNNRLAVTIPDVYNVAHVTAQDPNNPGDAHLVNIASGPRFVIHVRPGNRTKFDFHSTATQAPDVISFKTW